MPAGRRDAARSAAVVLAAGGATRMGRAKQVLAFRGEPLVRRAVNAALEAGVDHAIVVVGAHHSHVRDALAGVRAQLVENPEWSDGIGTSIRAGATAALDLGAERVVIMLADQPLVDRASVARLLVAQHATGMPIVASRYLGTVGVPALFSGPCALLLRQLTPGEGCKGLIARQTDRTHVVDCPEAGVDVDTPDDYRRVLDEADPVPFRAR